MPHVRIDPLTVDSKLPFVCVEVMDVAVNFYGRMSRSDLLAHEPSKMNDRQPFIVFDMPTQNVVGPLPVSHNLNRYSVQYVSGR